MTEYIKREAVHRMMVGLTRYRWTSPVGTDSRVTVDADDVNFGVDKIPAADVAPVVHGYWTVLDECANAGAYCSVCHKKVYKECYGNCKMKSNYCPNCGAKMDATDINVGSKGGEG